MKKHTKRWTSLLVGGLGLATVLIAVPTLTACSSGAIGHKVTTVKYNVTSQTRTFSTGTTMSSHLTKVFPAVWNTNAQSQIETFAESLSVGNLQYDFNRALTDFFDIYEASLKDGTEIEIENIRVIKQNENPKSFTLKVQYEVEKDRAFKDSDEITKFIDINWTPQFTTMTYDDIAQLTQTLRGYQDSDNQHGVDLEDLKELFLGEKDDDDFDFDDDDIGIFDKLGAINHDYANQSSIIAYNLKLADIFDPIIKHESTQQYAITTKANGNEITKDTPFKIPSLSLNSNSAVVLIPNEAPSFKFTSILNGADYDALFTNNAKESLDFKNVDDASLLNKVFANASDEWKQSVASIAVNKTQGTLIIQYTDTNKAWEEIVIARQFSLTPKA